MWDQRYDQDEYLFGTAPSQFLITQENHLKPGLKGLAVADGEGRNSVYMAQKGMNVTAMDNSTVGLSKAEQLASRCGVEVEFHHADLRNWDWTPEAFDIVVAIFFQFANPDFRSEIFKGVRRTLKPGGILLLHGYTPRQLDFGTGGPPQAENLYDKEMLAKAFDAFRIMRLEEYVAEIDEGEGHSGMSALIDLVAQK